MYVSMNPKGETGKVIHISQNDTNREVEFIPYDQNGLVKTTSDQTVAHINSIKGNTVSFNQLVQNGNFVSTSGWISNRGTISASNNILSYTITEIGTSFIHNRIEQDFVCVVGHKYYVKINVKPKATNQLTLRFNGSGDDIANFPNIVANEWNELKGIIVPTTVSTRFQIIFNAVSGYSVGDIIQTQNSQVFDLTLMGIDNLTTVAQVEAWLSSHIGDLPYFGYTQGTLIPFMGSGLKTTGKNLLQSQNVGSLTGVTINELNGTYTLNGTSSGYQQAISSTSFILQKGTYTLYINRSTSNTAGVQIRSVDGTTTYGGSSSGPSTFTLTEKTEVKFRIVLNAGTFNNVQISPQLELGSSATAFEPYTSNTLSLPTSTYFPTGMKSAGSVYDELSDKAYTRVGSVDLGTLEWNYFPSWGTSGGVFQSSAISDFPFVGSNIVANIITSRYKTVSRDDNYSNYSTGSVSLNVSKQLQIRNNAYSSPSDFKTAMSGVLLYYELDTPTETDISLDLTYPVWNGGTEEILPINDSTPDTAPIKANITYPDRTEDTEFLYKQTSFEWIYKSWAFVCKNITQALSVVGNALKGTIPSTMTSESGKFPLKVKMTDNDGVCFSEKIDIFVEKKP